MPAAGRRGVVHILLARHVVQRHVIHLRGHKLARQVRLATRVRLVGWACSAGKAMIGQLGSQCRSSGQCAQCASDVHRLAVQEAGGTGRAGRRPEACCGLAVQACGDVFLSELGCCDACCCCCLLLLLLEGPGNRLLSVSTTISTRYFLSCGTLLLAAAAGCYKSLCFVVVGYFTRVQLI